MSKDVTKPTIFTLCGSTKFEKEFHDWNKYLTFSGCVVLSLAVFPSQVGGEKDWYDKYQKAVLDQMHLDKIDASDCILVLNKDGYIGESTMREILYAFRKGKEVFSIESMGQHRINRFHPINTWVQDAPDDIYRVELNDLTKFFVEPFDPSKLSPCKSESDNG